jgi:hypothetical protein
LIDSVELLGDADPCVLVKNGNTDDELVVVVVGVDGAELDICSEDSSCSGSTVSAVSELSSYPLGSRSHLAL